MENFLLIWKTKDFVIPSSHNPPVLTSINYLYSSLISKGSKRKERSLKQFYTSYPWPYILLVLFSPEHWPVPVTRLDNQQEYFRYGMSLETQRRVRSEQFSENEPYLFSTPPMVPRWGLTPDGKSLFSVSVQGRKDDCRESPSRTEFSGVSGSFSVLVFTFSRPFLCRWLRNYL